MTTTVLMTSKAYLGAERSGKMTSALVHQTKMLEHAINRIVINCMYCMPSAMSPTNSVFSHAALYAAWSAAAWIFLVSSAETLGVFCLALPWS